VPSPLLPGVLAGLLLLGGCGGGEPSPESGVPPDPHAELRERLGLAPDHPIHTITLGGRGGDEHAAPSRVELRPGDVVEFLVVDGRVHTVRFPEDSLTEALASFLRRTDQLESPPLVERGSRFVLTFENAPRGRYPFVSEGTGGSARGVLLVEGG